DGAHLAGLGGVGLVQQQVDRLDHRGLAHLVLALQHHHTRVRQGDLPLGDSAEVDQAQPVDPHRFPPPASRYSRARESRATSRSAPSPAAASVSSATASATNPPTPSWVRSFSETCTATSVCRCHTRTEANVSRCRSSTASI